VRPYSRERLVGNRTVVAIQRQLKELCMQLEGTACPEEIHSSYAYDGVWAIALALNKSLQHEGDGGGGDDGNQRLLDAIRNTSFEGLSGRVRFENNERLGLVHILQWVDGSYSKVGYHDSTDGTFKLLPVGGWTIPRDATVSAPFNF